MAASPSCHSRVAVGVCLLLVVVAAQFDNASTLEVSNDIPILKKLAAESGIFIGAASNAVHYRADTEYDQLLAQQFSLTTPENSCKWTTIRHTEDAFNFTNCDFLVATAHKNNQTVRGHNLCWGVHNPDWLSKYAGNSTALHSLLTAHVRTVTGHYAGKLYAWDVVNEAVRDNPQGSEPSAYLKENIWFPAVPDYIDLAFQTAHEADKTVKLFYNDYNCEVVGKKSDAIYAMVKGMLSRGVPIHGVGLQSHFLVPAGSDGDLAWSVDRAGNLASPIPADWTSVSSNIKRFVDLGLEVHITEMDVKLAGGDSEENLKKQANIYSQMLKACLQHAPKCRSFEVWGFVDKYAYNAAGEAPDYFNATYQPKPCFYAVAAVFGPTASMPVLRQLGNRHGIFIGSASAMGHIKDDKQYAQLLGEQFSITTPENECKWPATQPAEAKFDFTGCDFIVQTAKANKQAVRGHNLCWGNSNPGWLNKYSGNGTALRSLLTQHIAKVAGRYSGQLYAWDVVNEAVSNTAKPGATLKHTIWYPAVPDFIDIAFNVTHAADSTAKLFYNDYSCSEINTKSNAIYAMVKSMVARQIPIHGVGLQAHLQVRNTNEVVFRKDKDLHSLTSTQAVNWTSVQANIARFVALGLEVHITEMDVALEGGATEERLKVQAEVYSNMLKACLAFAPKCRSYEVWEFVDKYSWLGTSKAPDLLDDNYQPKPCFQSVAQALNSTPIDQWAS